MHAYDCAWNAKEDPVFIERMYLLTVMEPELAVKEKFLGMMTEEKREEWDRLAEEASEEARNAEEVSQMEELFSRDPVKRLAGAGEALNRWKVEYRRCL